MKTKKNKPTPDLIKALKQPPHRAKKPTASEIANSFETEAKKLQRFADILRGNRD